MKFLPAKEFMRLSKINRLFDSCARHVWLALRNFDEKLIFGEDASGYYVGEKRLNKLMGSKLRFSQFESLTVRNNYNPVAIFRNVSRFVGLKKIILQNSSTSTYLAYYCCSANELISTVDFTGLHFDERTICARISIITSVFADSCSFGNLTFLRIPFAGFDNFALIMKNLPMLQTLLMTYWKEFFEKDVTPFCEGLKVRQLQRLYLEFHVSPSMHTMGSLALAIDEIAKNDEQPTEQTFYGPLAKMAKLDRSETFDGFLKIFVCVDGINTQYDFRLGCGRYFLFNNCHLTYQKISEWPTADPICCVPSRY